MDKVRLITRTHTAPDTDDKLMLTNNKEGWTMKLNKSKPKSKYAQKLEYRRKLSGSRHHVTTNQGQLKKYPLPLPLFQDV